jgi:hypothetical protein
MAALDRPIATGLVSGSAGSPVTTAPAAESAAAESQPTERSGGAGGIGWDAIVPVLGTIVTGAGLLGFVALFGGAILFARADEAGLPAAQTVALLPKSTLLATGAEFLVGAMLLACAAVALLWLLSVFLDPMTYRFFHTRLQSKDEGERIGTVGEIESRQTELSEREAELPRLEAALEKRRAELEACDAAHEEAGTAVRMCESALEERQQAAKGDEAALAGEELSDVQASNAKQRLADRDAAKTRYEQSLEHLTAARTARSRARDVVAEAEAALRGNAETMADIGNQLGESQARLAAMDAGHDERATARTSVARYVILCLALLLAEAVMLAAGDRVSRWHTVMLVVVSLLTSVLAVLVYHQTKKFVWFGVAAFLAIGVFIGWALSYSIGDDPRIEPVAALVKGQEPLVGAYLTQTKDRVYVGVPRFDDGKPPLNLVALDRAAVTGLSVARLAPPDQLKARGDEMVAALCERQPVAASAKDLRAAPQCPATMAALEAQR